MDYEALYPGRFLKGVTLDRPKVIKVLGVVGEKLAGDDGEKAKGVLRYVDAAKQEGELVWCKTNAALTAALTGTREIEGWVGQYLTIHYDTEVMLGGKRVGGIRVMGSPTLKAPLRVEVKRPRRKVPEIYTLYPTDRDGNRKDAAPTKEP